MKKILIYLLLVFPIFASEKIVLLENENSFFFYKVNGVNKGLYPKIFQDINEKEKLNFKVKELDANSILSRKNNNKCIMDLVETPERKKIYYFINTFFYAKASIYYLGDEKKDILDFYKKKLGIIEGSYIEKEYKKKYKFLENSFVDIKNRQIGMEMLKKGVIDGIVTDNQYGFLENLSSIYLDRIDDMQTSLAVPKNDKELYEKLKKYFETIPNEKLKRYITESRREYFKEKFKGKYSSLKGKKIKVCFPKDKTIYPFYYSENGKIVGITIDYLDDIKDILGLDLIQENCKYEHEREDLEAIGVIGEKRQGFIYTKPYYTVLPAIINRNEEGFVNNLLETKNSKYVMTRGAFCINYLKDIVPKENIIYVDTLNEAMDKIISKEADYCISDYKTIINKLYKSKYENKLKVAGVINKKYEVSFAINEKDKELVEAISQISASFFNQNISRNIYTSKNIHDNYVNKYLVLTILGLIVIVIILYFKGKVGDNERRKINKMMFSLIDALETVNQVNDNETGSHIKRLNKYSRFLALKLGKSKKFSEEIGSLASLHDIGKVGIDRNILRKPGKLTSEEFEEMKKHTEIGHEIIKKAKISSMAENIALYHHEKWNGNGYPFGIKEDEIPVEARIVSVVDVYDALRQKRVYKKAFTHEEAIEVIKKERGESFDPKIVDVFLMYEIVFKEMFDSNK